ncbi:MAG: hypothetical protein WC492_02525 [Candidatus Micrarchaeia archaeon]
MAETKSDSSKPIIAAILNLIIPGLGHWFIKSKYALHYFVGYIAVCILTGIITLISLGLCFPVFVLPLAWVIISILDVYYEAIDEPEKRMLKEYIK